MLLQSETSLAIGSLVEVTASGTRNIFVELEPGVLKITGGMVSMQVIHADGSVEVLASNTEMGQGAHTVLAQIATDALGLPYGQVAVARPDTGIVVPSDVVA